MNSNNIYLIGFMGCGKSTVAKGLSQMRGMQAIEMDQLLAEQAGMSIPAIFEKYGETYFRDLESALVSEIQSETNQVVSCGGGVVLRERNVLEMKKNGHIVLLTAKPETILKRVAGDDNRPILNGKKNAKDISELMEQRRPMYEAAADVVVETDDKSVQEICEEVIQKVKGIGE